MIISRIPSRFFFPPLRVNNNSGIAFLEGALRRMKLMKLYFPSRGFLLNMLIRAVDGKWEEVSTKAAILICSISSTDSLSPRWIFFFGFFIMRKFLGKSYKMFLHSDLRKQTSRNKRNKLQNFLNKLLSEEISKQEAFQQCRPEMTAKSFKSSFIHRPMTDVPLFKWNFPLNVMSPDRKVPLKFMILEINFILAKDDKLSNDSCDVMALLVFSIIPLRFHCISLFHSVAQTYTLQCADPEFSSPKVRP